MKTWGSLSDYRRMIERYKKTKLGELPEHYSNVFYLIKIKNSNTYKYGITENFINRMAQYKCHNPYDIEIIAIIETGLGSYLEAVCSESSYLSLNRIRGEWITLSEKEGLLLVKLLCEIATKHHNKHVGIQDGSYLSKEFKEDTGLLDCIFKNIVKEH